MARAKKYPEVVQSLPHSRRVTLHGSTTVIRRFPAASRLVSHPSWDALELFSTTGKTLHAAASRSRSALIFSSSIDASRARTRSSRTEASSLHRASSISSLDAPAPRVVIRGGARFFMYSTVFVVCVDRMSSGRMESRWGMFGGLLGGASPSGRGRGFERACDGVLDPVACLPSVLDASPSLIPVEPASSFAVPAVRSPVSYLSFVRRLRPALKNNPLGIVPPPREVPRPCPRAARSLPRRRRARTRWCCTDRSTRAASSPSRSPCTAPRRRRI